MTTKFKPGDVVQLKSGGPAMTVSKITTNTDGDLSGYRCEWFKGASNENAHFTPDVLQPYVAPKKA